MQAFPEENAAVQLQLVTAAVKLFLKSPQPRAQQMIQLVLTYATQVCRPIHMQLSPWVNMIPGSTRSPAPP